MDTFFIKLKDNKGLVVEIKRQVESKSDVEKLIKEEFPESEIVSVKMLLLD
jgi:hypothetical protein